MIILPLCRPALIVAAALAAATITATANPITIPNASFESPSTPTQSTTNDSLIPGWTFDPQKDAEFGTEAISSYFTSPGAASGNNFVFIQNNESNSKETITSAASLGTITPSTQYTLTVAIGNRRRGSFVELRHLPCRLGSSSQILYGPCPGFGCEIFYLPVGSMGQSSQYLTQVSSGVDPATTAAFNDGVQDRATIAGFGFADEQPVAFADGGGTDGIFHQVIVDLDAAFVEMQAERLPVV